MLDLLNINVICGKSVVGFDEELPGRFRISIEDGLGNDNWIVIRRFLVEKLEREPDRRRFLEHRVFVIYLENCFIWLELGQENTIEMFIHYCDRYYLKRLLLSLGSWVVAEEELTFGG